MTPAQHARPARPLPVRRAVLSGLVLLLGLATGALGGEDAALREALAEFGRAARARSAGARIEAVRALATRRHPQVAERLLKTSESEEDAEVLAVFFEALAAQPPPAPKVVARLGKRLATEAREEAQRLAAGDAGVRIDPRTGEADVTSPEGRARLLAGAQRGRMLAALLAALDAWGWAPRKGAPDLGAFLQHPSDDLVVATLARLGRTKHLGALPEVLELYRMYPTPLSWETGAVVDLAGTNATAKAKWMVRFGHPDKQRARPRVHEALVACLRQLTGREFPDPDALARHLAAAGR